MKVERERELVDLWMEEYGEARNEALLRLLQFFISASGCKGVISMALFGAGDFNEIINHMSNEVDEDSEQYPLIGSGPVLKKFPDRMANFINIVEDKAKEQVVFDEYMMHKLISPLISAADSEIRALRQTATHGALSLISALVGVYGTLEGRRAALDRQHDAELAQTTGPNPRLEQIIRQRQDASDKLTELKMMYGYLFKSVFIHRYRDSVWEIRALCIRALGGWMAGLLGDFLEDSYLKYIGWTLHDKKEEVRRQCLDALLSLYQNPDLFHKLPGVGERLYAPPGTSTGLPQRQPGKPSLPHLRPRREPAATSGGGRPVLKDTSLSTPQKPLPSTTRLRRVHEHQLIESRRGRSGYRCRELAAEPATFKPKGAEAPSLLCKQRGL